MIFVDHGKLPTHRSVDIKNIFPKGSTYWLSDVPDDIKLVVGMTFDDIDIAYEFYRRYAIKSSFPSRRSSENKINTK